MKLFLFVFIRGNDQPLRPALQLYSLPLLGFWTNEFLWRMVVSPMSNPQPGGPDHSNYLRPK